MARPAKPMTPAPTPLELCAEGALSVEGCAEFCGDLSPDEVRKAIAAGEIEPFHRGRRVLIAKREAVRWLAAMLEADRAKRGMR